MNPLERASIYYSQLSKAEKQVCDQFLSNPNAVIQKTITEVADLFHVSISAIQRFVKRIGYKGYSEFQYAMENSQTSDATLQKQPFNSQYKTLLDAFSTTLDILKQHDMDEALAALAQLIKTKRNIRLCGFGSSNLPCRQLMYMLLLEGKEANVYMDNVDMMILPEHVHADDLVILYTVSARKKYYESYIRSLKKKNVTCVIITMNQESDLLPLFDLSIIIPVSSYHIHISDHNVYHIDNRSLMNIITEIIMFYYKQALLT